MIILLPGHPMLRILHAIDRLDRDQSAPDNVKNERPSQEVRPGVEENARALVLLAKSLHDTILGRLALRSGGDGLECRVDGVVVDRHTRILLVVLSPGDWQIVSVGPLLQGSLCGCDSTIV